MDEFTVTLEMRDPGGLVALADETSLGSQYDNKQAKLVFVRPEGYEDHNLLLAFSSSFGKQIFSPVLVQNDQFVLTNLYTQGERLKVQVLLENGGTQQRSNVLEYTLRPSLQSFRPPAIDLPTVDIPSVDLNGLVVAEVMSESESTGTISNTGDDIRLSVISKDELDGKAYLTVNNRGVFVNGTRVLNLVDMEDRTLTESLCAEIVDLVYPVGSIYLSMNYLNPSTIFPGTKWESFGSGRMLMGAHDIFTVGSEGGSSTVTLTPDNMPQHEHQYTKAGTVSLALDAGIEDIVLATPGSVDSTTFAGHDEDTIAPIQVLPPYVAVHFWKRVELDEGQEG